MAESIYGQLAMMTARPEQIQWAWAIWLILAGRGWGKTRTGAEDHLISSECPQNAVLMKVKTRFAGSDILVIRESAQFGAGEIFFLFRVGSRGICAPHTSLAQEKRALIACLAQGFTLILPEHATSRAEPW